MSDSPAPAGSAIAQLGNLFVAPAHALDYAFARPKMLWLPLGLTLALNTALGAWFALSVNLAAWRAMMVRMAAARNPDAANAVAELYSRHGRGFLLAQFAGGSLIGLLLIELVFALYLFLADKLFSAASRSYARWLSFTSWTWLPVCVGILAAMIAWALSNHGGNVQFGDITTLNALFFHLPSTSRYYDIAQFSILQFWVIGLVTYGLKRWCSHATGKALGIALAPYVVVYGILFIV